MLEFLWILAAMHISAYTTSSQAFDKFLDFYGSSDIHDYAPEEIKKSLSDFDITLSISNSDIFCNKQFATNFCDLVALKYQTFDWTFHNPMHLPWSQDDFNTWIQIKDSLFEPGFSQNRKMLL